MSLHVLKKHLKSIELESMKSLTKAKVLDIKSAFVPATYQGVWRRSLLENKQTKDDTSLVLWMQTQHHHLDIRIPESRADFASSEHKSYESLEDFTIDELRMLASQQGFYGVTHVQRNICRWQREVDFQPDNGTRDIAEIVFGNPNMMLETGVDDDYFEIWHKYKDSHLQLSYTSTFGLNRHGEERVAYMLTAGNQVAYARPRDVIVPTAQNLLAAIDEHKPDRETLLDWLDCEISFGEKTDDKHWKILYSTLPFREGKIAHYA